MLFPQDVVVFFMHIILLCIGATAKGFLDEGIKEYTKRLERYTTFSLQILPAIRNAQSLSAAELKQREGARFLEVLQPTDTVVVLDERGTERSSRGLAAYLQTEMNAGRRRVVFIVGGVYGVSEELRSRAASTLRLSAMTLTHDMVRLLFVEQLYRAFTILGGEKYHHD
jgi:23S rRNA (pseudouridine1915-N3)-methyltransferase